MSHLKLLLCGFSARVGIKFQSRMTSKPRVLKAWSPDGGEMGI